MDPAALSLSPLAVAFVFDLLGARIASACVAALLIITFAIWQLWHLQSMTGMAGDAMSSHH